MIKIKMQLNKAKPLMMKHWSPNSTDHLIGGKGPHDQTKKSQTAEEGVLLLLGVTERHQAKIPNMQMT